MADNNQNQNSGNQNSNGNQKDKQGGQQPSTGLSGRYEIEIASRENNKNHTWGPTKEKLRGRWDRLAVRLQSRKVGITQMPTIPGQHVVVDISARTASIVDPLNRPDHSDLFHDIRAKMKGSFGNDIKVSQDVVRENVSNHTLAEWVYWMRRAIDAGYAREVPGSQTIPPVEHFHKIAGNGIRIRVNCLGSSGAKYLSEVTSGL